MSEAFWNSFAPAELTRNRDNPEDHLYFRIVLGVLREFLSDRDSVLDVGAGAGRFSLELAPWVNHVEHLDLSQAMLDTAAREATRRAVTNVSFVKADARDLSRYADSHFDKVLAINTPVSFAGRAWRSALGEICRVAREGVFFTVSNFVSAFPRVLELASERTSCFGELVPAFFRERFFDGGFASTPGSELPSYRAFLPGEIEPELERLGFRIQRVAGVAILCRLMSPGTLKPIVSDAKLFEEFLTFEAELAVAYGPWAPSREIMFMAQRRAV